MVHSPQRQEWTQEKNNYRGEITDETYQGIVGYHNPMWRYMINNHDGYVLPSINVIGYTAIPLAIEFSQWGFPTTYITSTYEGVKKAKSDASQHSGKFKDLLYMDFTYDYPPAELTLFINIIDRFPTNKIFDFLDLSLRRTKEVICAVRNDRDWRGLLSRKYRLNMSQYKDNQFILLIITK